MRQHSPKKVFVGLSGGVDSSVSALLLKQKGFEATGVFIHVWRPPFFECTWRDDRLDAMRVCARLGIPFIELNLEKEYKKEVVDYMIREYKAGKTPNPDVFCNRFIKFGGFYDWAMKHGADFVATGHYARVGTREFPIFNSQFSNRSKKKQGGHTNSYTLQAGADNTKDQSYFLWQIRRDQLPHILFPVGNLKKTEVRALAKKHNLITADKKDSQGLCFVGNVDMKEFLSHFIKQKLGKVLCEKGDVLGEHSGSFFYTLGERVSVSTPRLRRGAEGGVVGPSYVISKNLEKNTLTVSQKSPRGNLGGTVTGVAITDCNWFSLPKASKTYLARTRYRQPLERCTFKVQSSKVVFDKPQTVAPGQSLVIYDGDTLIGGGIIDILPKRYRK